MGWIWWVVISILAALFILLMYAVLCCADPISMDDEARLLQMQEKEYRLKKAMREKEKQKYRK